MTARISLVVAIDRNRVIGVGNKMPWHLPADLKRFKELTSGHHVIMGRKTFESIIASLGKPLPGRTSVVITRQRDYKVSEGCRVVHDLDEARRVASGDSEIYVVGGGEIYAQALPIADRVYLTEVDLAVEGGDTFFPALDPAQWRQTERLEHAPDAKNAFAYAYLTFEKRR